MLLLEVCSKMRKFRTGELYLSCLFSIGWGREGALKKAQEYLLNSLEGLWRLKYYIETIFCMLFSTSSFRSGKRLIILAGLE